MPTLQLLRHATLHVEDGVPVVPDHMDAINHCLLTRADLRAAVDGVTIPADGETVEF